MMIKYHSVSLCLCLFCFVLIIFVHPSCATTRNVTELVNEVCAKTSNYSFCVKSLYSDPHTPESDRYGLEDVAFRLAYQNATSTRGHIAKLLKKAISYQYRRQLQRCAPDYKKAASSIGTAYDDLNSETFYDLAGVAAHSAADCEATFKGTHSPFTSMNNALKGLCEICVVISKLFTGF